VNAKLGGNPPNTHGLGIALQPGVSTYSISTLLFIG